MSRSGRWLLVCVCGLFSIACGAQQKESSAPGELAPDEQEAKPKEAEGPAPAAPPAPEAASQSPVSSTNEKDEERADSLSDAIAEFDRARAELSGLIGRELGGNAAGSAPTGGASAPAREPAKSPAPAADKPASRSEAHDNKATAMKKGDDACVNVCRALESLTRSAAAVCRLDEGERCKKANSVVSVAVGDSGVKACGCKR